MPGNSRLRILEHIRMHGEASIADLSRDLNLTPVTVRHHVDALSEQGLVTHGSLRRKPGPGRPEAMYQSTPLAAGFLPRNYGELGGSLITELAASMPVDRLEGLLVLAARRLAASLPPPMERMGSDRLGHVTGLLEAIDNVQKTSGDLKSLLGFNYTRFLQDKRKQLTKMLNTLTYIGEAFVTLMVVTPILFIVMLTIFTILGGGIGGAQIVQLNLLVFFGMPLFATGFLIVLDTILEVEE